MDEGKFKWFPTSAPHARRYDDVWFVEPEVGWAVNSNGLILHTKDGGGTWHQQFQVTAGDGGVWLRCVSFANDKLGWVGTTSPEKPMYHTIHGGENQSWKLVENLPKEGPKYTCGLHVVNESVIYASGVNNPSDRSAAVIKSIDGGTTWRAFNLEHLASNLIDIYFSTPDRGWVVGGFTDNPEPSFDLVKPVILYTEDGGENWENLLKDQQEEFPLGTWGWKIQFVNEDLAFVSLENFTQALILRSLDGGMSWLKITVNDNADLEGIGFLNEREGWVGGWGPRNALGQAMGTSSVTTDFGYHWQNADFIGKFLNRFRFYGDPLVVGYSGGDTVYKYAEPPAVTPEIAAPTLQLLPADSHQHFEKSATIDCIVPTGVERFTIQIWNQFANLVRTLVDEHDPSPGARSVIWDGLDQDGKSVPSGTYVYRLTADDVGESRMISLKS